MKNDPKIKIQLNEYEERLLNFITKHSGFSLLEISRKTKMNKNTTAKYLELLCNYDLIEVVELKQGEKAYVPRVKETKSFSESHRLIKNDFNSRKSIIRESIMSLNNASNQEIVYVYSKCIDLVFSFDKFVKFIISSNKHKKPIKQWLELEKEIQEFLDEITTRINNRLFMSILTNMKKSDTSILDELEYFNKTKQQRSVK